MQSPQGRLEVSGRRQGPIAVEADDLVFALALPVLWVLGVEAVGICCPDDGEVVTVVLRPETRARALAVVEVPDSAGLFARCIRENRGLAAAAGSADPGGSGPGGSGSGDGGDQTSWPELAELLPGDALTSVHTVPVVFSEQFVCAMGLFRSGGVALGEDRLILARHMVSRAVHDLSMREHIGWDHQTDLARATEADVERARGMVAERYGMTIAQASQALDASARARRESVVRAARRILDRESIASVVQDDPRLALLGGQERRILALVAEGLTNLQIADRLGITEKTVKNYVSKILDKLGLDSRTKAAILVVKLGRAVDEEPVSDGGHGWSWAGSPLADPQPHSPGS